MSRFDDQLMKIAQHQAGEVLLDSTIEFLIRNGFPQVRISARLNRRRASNRSFAKRNAFNTVVRAYEDMGSVLSTWYDCPDFLNRDGSPAPITIGPSRRSVRRLLKESGVRTSADEAIDLFMRSSSVRFDGKSKLFALRRVFVVPKFDLARAALVVPRYLDTLSSNSTAHQTGTVKLLERQCSASRIDLKSIAPILRRIKEEGTSFVDSIDAQLEESSVKQRERPANSELGLVVFAWTNGYSRKTKKRQLKARRPSGTKGKAKSLPASSRNPDRKA
jgi:hypothetical protein